MEKRTEYTLDELKEKAKLALQDPICVTIVKTAPPIVERISLSMVFNNAWTYGLWKTENDEEEAEKLATSTRFLGMIKRDYPEEFEKLIAEKTAKPAPEEPKKEIPEPPEKKFEDIEFELPPGTELITRERISYSFPNRTSGKKIFLSLSGEKIGLEFLIEILEEKGLKIKTCGNCRDYNKCLGRLGGQLLDKFHGCEGWHSKEIPSEKK